MVPKRRELELPTCSETRRGRIAPRAIVGDQGASLQRRQDGSSVLRRARRRPHLRRVSSEAGAVASGDASLRKRVPPRGERRPGVRPPYGRAEYLRGGERRHQGMPPYGGGASERGAAAWGQAALRQGDGSLRRRCAAVRRPCGQGRLWAGAKRLGFSEKFLKLSTNFLD